MNTAPPNQRSPGNRIRDWIAAYAQLPLFRNAFMLIINAAASSGLGMLYWVLAARYYSADVVGISSAALSAMTFLSGIAQMSLNDTLMRYVPPSGQAVHRLIGYSYLTSIALGLGLGIVFLAGLQVWSPSLEFLRANVWIEVVFVLSISFMAVFTLQDSVLTGLRRPTIILIENAVFGILKLVLLVGAASWLHEYGIFISSVLPMAILTLPVNALIFWRLGKDHIAATKNQAQAIDLHELVRYISGNYLGTIASVMTFTVLPIMVVNVLGKADGAHYYLPALLATSLRLVAVNLSSSLTVEASLDQDRLYEFCRKIIKSGLQLVGLLAVITIIGAPYILQVFGQDYADNGTMLLRLLAVAAVPNIVVMAYLGIVRVQNRLRETIILTVVQAVMQLGISAWLLPMYGITGIGIAFVVCQTLVAIVLLATVLKPVLQHNTTDNVNWSDEPNADTPAINTPQNRTPPAAPLLVSIVIDNYNYGRYLRAAIDSALNQTYPHVEVIVVDDGSTDNSHDIIASYRDRIRPLLKVNGGQESAINAGFEMARGDIIIFLDSDDMLLPNTAQQVQAKFAADPTLVKVQYRMDVVDAAGKHTGNITPPAHMPLPAGDVRRYVLTFAGDMPIVALSGNAFSAHVLRQVFPIPTHLFSHAPDHFLCNVTSLFGNVATLDNIGAQYRVHGANHYSQPGLNLPRIRKEIGHQQSMHHFVSQYAKQLNLNNAPHDANEILSVSSIINRLISLKLEPDKHPVQCDTVWSLVRLGNRAASRRFDVSPSMRLFYRAWFVVMAIAPHKTAWWLADMMMFPHKRPRLINATFGRLQRA
jgi:O-antigen/teichoic acid export membrane protein